MVRFKSMHMGTCCAMLFCLTSVMQTAGGIVSGANGTIDLQLDPFWPKILGTGEPTASQIVSVPIGLKDVSASIDGTGYYSAHGLSEVDYRYTQVGHGGARFDFYSYAGTEDSTEGGGGSAGIQLDITFSAPVYFRFEADAFSGSILYEVAFNGVSAYASYDAYFGGYYGTFPFKYIYENDEVVYTYGWDTYVHEGILPAGTYHLSTEAVSSIHGRYLVGLDSGGTASLYVQLLGDVNGNGSVGIEDLNRVLNHWNRSSHQDKLTQGDLNGDGYVGIEDLNQVLMGWNSNVKKSAQSVSLPEPANLSLLLLASLIMHRQRTIGRS